MHQDPSNLKAGAAKLEITCREGGVWESLLSEKVQKHIPPDYLRQEVKVADPLFVRALVLQDEAVELVLVTMDVTAIGARSISQNILSDSADDFMPQLRQRVENDLGIPGDHVTVCASHTHQVPRMLCDDETQIERTVEAIRRARRSLGPVTVGIGAVDETGLSANRTMMMKDGTDYTVRSYHSPMPPDEMVERLRPVDPEITILRVDHLDGRPLAVVHNFAVHLGLGAPDGTRAAITADHVGVTLRYLEENIGGGVTAFFLQGALGDVQEACCFDTHHPPSARAFGTRLGQRVLEGYRTVKTDAATLALAHRTTPLPLRTDLPGRIAALRGQQAELLASLRYTSLNFKAFLPLYLQQTLHPEHPSHWAYRYLHARAAGDIGWTAMDERNRSAVAKYLEGIQAMESMAHHEEILGTLVKHQEVIDDLGADTVPAQFQGIRIGEAVFITAPMEILSETGLKLKRGSPFQHTGVVSLANGYLHYAPPPAYYDRGGYEANECLLAPAWERIFDAVVQDLYRELRRG